MSSERLEWPPPYKGATEKYSTQVRLNEQGELANYIAGLPFPLLDPNDPQIAAKVMWNFSFRPQYTDDVIDSEGCFITASDQYEQRGQALEDHRDIQRIRRSSGARREGRDLPIQVQTVLVMKMYKKASPRW